MKKNSVIRVKIESVSSEGVGIARVDGEVIFIPSAAVGDELEAVVIKEMKSYSIAKILSVISPSDVRKDPDCPVFLKCGGCALRHVTLEEEERIKTENVKSVMKRIGKISVEVKNTVTPAKIGYRNKAQLPVSEDEKGIHCGFFAPHSHRIVDESLTCKISPEVFGDISKFIISFMKENDIKGYNEDTKNGTVRHFYFRINKKEKVMVTLVLKTKTLRDAKTETLFAKEITKRFPCVVSVFINHNDDNTNVVLGKDFRCIFGEEFFEDELFDCKFKMSPESFFQVNREGAELVYSTAFSLLDEKFYENVYDLYCGIGSIGITLFKEIKDGSVKANAKRLIGVEIVEKAVECAIHNARTNGIDNAIFKASDSSDITKSDLFDKYPPSLVILDPPRKGTTTALLDFLAEKGVNDILYISCDPATLARDMGYLFEKGYTSSAVHPINLFAGTKHVECCVKIYK